MYTSHYNYISKYQICLVCGIIIKQIYIYKSQVIKDKPPNIDSNLVISTAISHTIISPIPSQCDYTNGE